MISIIALKNKKFVILLFLITISWILFENLFFENIIYRALTLYEKKNIYISFYYIFVSILGFISIALFLFIKNKVIYIIFLLWILITSTLDLTYKNINGIGCTLNDINIIELEGKDLLFESIFTYRKSILQALATITIFLIFIYVIRRLINKNSYFIEFKWGILLYIVSGLFSFSIIHKTMGSTNTRPTNIKILNSLIYHYSNRVYYGPREELKHIPSSSIDYKNIILIIDESIEGEYLSINGFEYETTPYLKSIQNSYINLGITSSGSNCSAASNLILMSGIQLSELPDIKNISLKGHSIFQYAKNAGFKTHYLNGQGFSTGFSNFMNKYDLKHIDNHFILKKHEFKSMPEEDLILKTKDILNNSDKNFIFMIKRGSHFPWESDYPKTNEFFTPTLKVNSTLTFAKKKEAINSYLNAIKYTVDEFFKSFLNQIDFNNDQNTLIIYTSDHGQSILEKDRKSTHCDTENPPLTQGQVPLLLFSNKTESLISNFNFKSNIYSHFQIFPTIQKLMGYKILHGKTLFEINENNFNQKFVSGNFFSVQMQLNDINKK